MILTKKLPTVDWFCMLGAGDCDGEGVGWFCMLGAGDCAGEGVGWFCMLEPGDCDGEGVGYVGEYWRDGAELDSGSEVLSMVSR